MAENEYIRKAQVKRAFGRLLNDERSANEIFQSGFEYGVNLAWLKIENISAADVAPVVRCKDCIFRDAPDEYGKFCCNRTGEEMQQNDFCSYGKQREQIFAVSPARKRTKRSRNDR